MIFSRFFDAFLHHFYSFIILLCFLFSNINTCYSEATDNQAIINLLKNTKINARPTTLDNAKHAVVSIRIKDLNGGTDLRNARTKKWGSGVLVAENLILTNHHVIGSKDELASSIIIIDHISTQPEQAPQLKEVKINLNKNAIFLTNEKYDFTFFEIEPTPLMSDGSHRPIPSWHNNIADYEKNYVMISNPMGQSIWTSKSCTGDVNQEVLTKYNKASDEYAIFHLCDTFPGSSGAPLFDTKGNLLAIHKMTYWDPIKPYVAEFNEGVSYPFILKTLTSNSDEAMSKNINIEVTKQLEQKANNEAASAEWGIESLLFGLPPGHEDITKEAVRRLFYRYPGISTLENPLIDGNISVDYPTFWGVGPNLVELYRSHYGKNAYRHAMLTDEEAKHASSSKEKTIKLHTKLLSYIEHQTDKFIKMDAIDRQEGARELGRLLHTLQDSYSLAHTSRDPSGIKEFYYYKDDQHDKEQHKRLDMVRDVNTWQFTKEAEMAIEASMDILSAAYSRSGKEKDTIIDTFKNRMKLSNLVSTDITAEKNNRNNINNVLSNHLSVDTINHSIISTLTKNIDTPTFKSNKTIEIPASSKDSDLIYFKKTIVQTNLNKINASNQESGENESTNTLPTKWPPEEQQPPINSRWAPERALGWPPARPVDWPPGGSD